MLKNIKLQNKIQTLSQLYSHKLQFIRKREDLRKMVKTGKNVW